MALWPRLSLSLALIGAEVIVLFIYFLLLAPSSSPSLPPSPPPPPPPPIWVAGRCRSSCSVAGLRAAGGSCGGPGCVRARWGRGDLGGGTEEPSGARAGEDARAACRVWGDERQWRRGLDAPAPGTVRRSAGDLQRGRSGRILRVDLPARPKKFCEGRLPLRSLPRLPPAPLRPEG